MIDDYRRLLLKAPTKPPLPGAQSIRCSVCQESLTVCKGAHGSATATPQRDGYDPAVLSSHKSDCPRVTGEDGSCWCRVNDPCAI